MIYYFEFDEIKKLYIRKKLGEEELNNNKCFTIDGSGDSFKVIVYCNVELALNPNTIVLSDDEELNKYWWVVQEDKSTLIDTNLYKHELQLVGAIEWFKFKFCYTGTFYYHRYSYYEVMEKLLYGLMRPLYIYFNLENFKTKFGSEKKNQKFSFKGYTVRSALSEIEKALNVDFKLNFRVVEYGDYAYIDAAYFTFIYKNPKNSIEHDISELDEKYQISQFPNKSYASRVIGRVSNVTNGGEISFPKTGYRKLNALNNTVVNKANACLILPYNIDKIGKIRIKKALGAEGIEYLELLETTELIDNPLILGYTSIDGTNVYPELELRLKEKTLYDMTEDANEKKYCLWYEKGKNIIYGFENLLKKGHYFFIDNDSKKGASIGLGIDVFKVFYNPIIDEIIITKSTNISCDDVIYNQTGQNVDAELTKEFIDSYADSISIGTLTKSKYHNKESECFKCGDVFVKDDERYVVSSVSIDKYKDVVYAEYKLSKDYVAKTELISADGSIESYAIPQNNIVKRIQEYKTLIRFNDDLVENVNSYLTNTFAISFLWTDRNDYAINAKCTASDDTNYYVGLQAANIETPKSTTSVFDFYDNNYCGFRVLEVVEPLRTYYAQYPYNYVDSNGEIKSFELKIKWGIDSSNFPYLTEQEYNNDDDTIAKINEPNYRKDGYEIPIFLITREYNDSNGYIFGNNVSRPANSNLYYLTLYTSNTPITSQNINFDNLTKIHKINVSGVRNGVNNSQYFELSYKLVDELSRFYAKGKNLVVARENDSGTKELMFAINNYKKEFDYQSTKQTDSAGNVLHYSQTYTWIIYLETYKI